ncbi:MAG: hypothetical protein K9K65_01690 [Desulfarculaceae bacterium]|nr:hypothetical protein [Desulfarculaceae bacterium]MCF8048244.1 hypothetical protein [Desulfarculaceae bacterium]MCF8064291.1 hypothetical protein [Desulfarculaceae bacterium]MCF8096530.1 hypothetical protein [Desulfarculaceae bacterium]MCF8121784.1 hypothetical protein [Desulfarculaceae bacterium]
MPEKGPVKPYLEVQGRFKALGPETKAEFQRNVDRSWQSLTRKCDIAV